MLLSCNGLREHIRERQLETHGPPRSIRDQRNVNRDSNQTVNHQNRNYRPDKTGNNGKLTAVHKKYSAKWGVELSGKEDPVFVEAIDGWLGVPYVYGGESKKGTDCSGMIQTLYKEIYGINLQRSANDMQKDVDFIDLNKGQLGDILFFKVNFKTVGHVALYLGQRKFIHATVSRGVMISCLDEDYYSKRYYKIGKLKAMAGR